MSNDGFLTNIGRRVTAAFFMVALAASIAHAQVAVTAIWDANTDSYTAGYRLYYGTSPGSYQWEVDAGNQTQAPLNLSPGSIYYFAVRGYTSTLQYGPPSNEASIDLRQSPPPAPTAQITASLSGTNTAVVTWQTTNAASAAINGVAVGPSGSTSVTISTTTTFTLVATSSSGATATASATVTLSTATAPGAPSSMAATVSGSRATLSWRAPATGGTPTSYLLSVGTSTGGSDITNALNVGNVLTVSGDLPRGRYYARVRAANGAGTSGSSNEVSFRIGRSLRTPTGFRVTWQGTTATLSWTASAADAPEDVPSGYVLEAGSRPGLSDVAVVNVGNATSFRADLPSGLFYVRLRAVNDLGDSDPTADLVLSPPGAPRPPTALAATGTGSTVDLRWTAGSGPAATGYIIEAGSAPGLADLAVLPVGAQTQFVTTAPPGVYYVRVRAVNGRGPSEASNEIVVRR